MHPDVRSTIERALRGLRAKLAGPYIAESLERFEQLLPLLPLGREIVLQRQDIADKVPGWSLWSIGRFLGYLHKVRVINLRSAGRNGLAITLRMDVTKSPWVSRREDAPQKEDSRVIEERDLDPLRDEVEFSPMVGMPDDAEGTTLNLDTMLAALDAVSSKLRTIDMSFTADLTGRPAARCYAAKETVAVVLGDLAKIRAAVSTGENRDLESVLE